jgi:hypothetical protein
MLLCLRAATKVNLDTNLDRGCISGPVQKNRLTKTCHGEGGGGGHDVEPKQSEGDHCLVLLQPCYERCDAVPENSYKGEI